MSQFPTAAYGMYGRDIALPDVVGALNQAGYDSQSICMVLSPAHPDAFAVRASAFDAEQGRGARMIGWFSEFGAVVIPTIGFFIRSQAFLEALFDEERFSSLSRGCRALMGLGFAADDAQRLGNQISDVGALVYVRCKKGVTTDEAIGVLRRFGAREAASLTQRALGMAAS